MSRTLDANRVVAPPDLGPAGERRFLSQPRVAGALVLGAWASLFWFLLLSGRVNLYLSTRTSWIAPVGAIVLTAAMLGGLMSARVTGRQHLRRREAVVMAAMVVPVVIVMASPPATLGSFSASRKATFSGTIQNQYGIFDASSEVTLLAVAAGETSDEGAELLASRAGEEVDFVGFVTRYADTPADELFLTRYVITCCVADTTVVQVRVVNVTPGVFQPDDWIEVKGQLFPLGRDVIVSATSIEKVLRPERPYLTP